jgi:hypothetical protein
MSKFVVALIAAMYTAGGTHGRYALAWQTLAQRDEVLRAAVRTVFGKRLPTLQKLGSWLSEHIGAHGDYLREGKHSLKRKAWAYRVVTLAEVAEQERKRREEEAQLHAQHEAQQAAIRETERQRAEAAEKDRQRAAEAEAARLEASPYEYQTRVDGQGHVIRTLMIGRDGQPLRKHAQSAAPEKSAEPERPKTRVEQMRADYLAHHQQHNVLEHHLGFANPGGIVRHNMAAEQDDGYRCRVAGRWPT